MATSCFPLSRSCEPRRGVAERARLLVRGSLHRMDDATPRTLALRLRGEQMVKGLEEAGALPGSEERLVVGVIGMAMSLAILLYDGSIVAGRLFGWTSLLMIAAVGLAFTGLQGVRRRNRRTREIKRAVAEWRALRTGLPGQPSPTRWLLQRGYREFAVRRWIKREAHRDRVNQQR